MEHTEEADPHTEEVIEAPIAKPKKKMTYTPEQLEKKRESMKKAREFRNISYKEEVKTLKKKLEEKEIEPEPEPEPVIIKKVISKPKPKSKIIYEEEEDDDDEFEEVIVRRRAICPSGGQRPKKTIVQKQTQYIERPDLIDETYKEQLQKKLQEARRQQVMADLFDF